MKNLMMLIGILFFAGAVFNSFAADKSQTAAPMMHHNKMHSMTDERISLNFSPAMKQHQLANMRAHVDAVRSIVGLVSEGSFDEASRVAHAKLGLTEEMKKMCNNFKNERFRNLGLAFHKSGDALGDVLQTKDVIKSLSALQTTLGYCVQCHATFRQ